MAGILDAMRRYGGMYGSAFRNERELAEVVEVSGAVEINRVEIPLVGQTKQGYKPGRESREGSIRIHKIDTFWEIEIYQWLSQGLATRRANRDPAARQFDLKLQVNDPEAYDVESWLLSGCMIWRLPLGFSITDDIIDREFPFTWESEKPVDAFVVTDDNATRWKTGDAVPTRAAATA